MKLNELMNCGKCVGMVTFPDILLELASMSKETRQCI